MSDMRLNGLGQCPVCHKKPLAYKRWPEHFFCSRCCRQFSCPDGKFQPNWKWDGPMIRRPHPDTCLCPECLNEDGEIPSEDILNEMNEDYREDLGLPNDEDDEDDDEGKDGE